MTDCIAESENRVASVSVVLHKWSCSAHQVRAHTRTHTHGLICSWRVTSLQC